eukprot:CAMPEP_0177635618 /NCGR_PEP_ID=MMETSP0447-20121125/4000_1 /TAXON_ID=0 /ORGANISM="Stygamoeba regulata, Strain BSH-02190019" /LENGTH=237 /DNA_ID=CAMNT_0019137423 /DNA_START=182 /DNA_END=892 /DNA_ORIENTATION=-
MAAPLKSILVLPGKPRRDRKGASIAFSVAQGKGPGEEADNSAIAKMKRDRAKRMHWREEELNRILKEMKESRGIDDEEMAAAVEERLVRKEINAKKQSLAEKRAELARKREEKAQKRHQDRTMRLTVKRQQQIDLSDDSAADSPMDSENNSPLLKPARRPAAKPLKNSGDPDWESSSGEDEDDQGPFASSKPFSAPPPTRAGGAVNKSPMRGAEKMSAAEREKQRLEDRRRKLEEKR